MTKDKLPDLGLLDYLSFKVGCMYLSDLYEPKYLPKIQRILRQTDCMFFCLREWNDAVHYITGNEMNFDSPEKAARYLVTYVAKGKEYQGE